MRASCELLGRVECARWDGLQLSREVCVRVLYEIRRLDEREGERARATMGYACCPPTVCTTRLSLSLFYCSHAYRTTTVEFNLVSIYHPASPLTLPPSLSHTSLSLSLATTGHPSHLSLYRPTEH